MHITVSHMSEGCYHNAVFFGDSLSGSDGLGDHGRCHTKVLSNSYQTIPGLDARERWDETAPRHHHLFPSARIIGPFELLNMISLADIMYPVHVPDDNLSGAIRLHDQEGIYLAGVPAQGLFNHLEGMPVHDLTTGQFYTGRGDLGDRVNSGVQVAEDSNSQGAVFRLGFKF